MMKIIQNYLDKLHPETFKANAGVALTGLVSGLIVAIVSLSLGRFPIALVGLWMSLWSIMIFALKAIR